MLEYLITLNITFLSLTCSACVSACVFVYGGREEREKGWGTLNIFSFMDAGDQILLNLICDFKVVLTLSFKNKGEKAQA